MRGLMSPISAMTFPWPRRPIPSQRFSRVLVLGVLLSDLFIAGIVALSLSQGLVKERNQAEVTTDNLSKVLEESIVGLIGGIDLTLLSVRDEVERQEAAAASMPRRSRRSWPARTPAYPAPSACVSSMPKG